MASSDANLNPSVDDETANQGKTIIVKIASFFTPTNQFSSTSLNIDILVSKLGSYCQSNRHVKNFRFKLKYDFGYSVITYNM